MEKQFVTTSDTPVVTLEEIGGDLKLKGWDEAMVVIKNSTAEEISLEQREDKIILRCTSNCSVRVPRQAVVTIQAVRGNAVVKGLEGALSIKEVNGDLELRSVGLTDVAKVNGNLSAKNILSDLVIGASNGDVIAKDVQGDCTVKDIVNGNLRIDDVNGSASGRSNGDITLRLDPNPGEEYNFTADGNIVLRMPDDVSAEVTANYDGNLTINLGGVQQVNEQGDEPFHAKFGDGDARIILSARGDVIISGQAPDWEMGDFGKDIGKDFGESFEGMAESISDQFAGQIEAQMEMVGQQIEIQMERLAAGLSGVGLSEEQRQRIEERARQAGERAAERAREKSRQAQERLERKLEAAQRRAEAQVRASEHRAHAAEHRTQVHLGRRSWNFNIPTPPIPPFPPAHDPVSDEERMTILRMLEQKKVSLDEAEKLLSALEGK